MIGIILCCHGKMGEGMRSATELIVGPQEKFSTIGLFPGEGQEELKRKLKTSIDEIGDDGVIILADLPGGTPCNVAISLADRKIKIIAGFNLPLLLKIVVERLMESDLDKIINDAPEYTAQTVLNFSSLQ